MFSSIKESLEEQKPIPIFTFSGTGNTCGVVTALAAEFERRNRTALVVPLPLLSPVTADSLPEIVGFAGPVYGMDLPDIMIREARRMPRGEGRKAFILVTAAGGDDKMNLNSHVRLERILKGRGWTVVYVRYFMMGSNWLVRFPDRVSRMLYEAMLKKIPDTAQGILSESGRGLDKRERAPLIFRFLGPFVHFQEEQFGARLFGLSLKAGSTCTRCGICVKGCPSRNISLKKGGIRFGIRCGFCMKCINRCPAAAIRSTLFPFFHFKEPYLLEKVIKADNTDSIPLTDNWIKQLEARKNYFEDPGL